MTKKKRTVKYLGHEDTVKASLLAPISEIGTRVSFRG
jgi:hypothetical protein